MLILVKNIISFFIYLTTKSVPNPLKIKKNAEKIKFSAFSYKINNFH